MSKVESPKFKVGDDVVCIDNSYATDLSENCIYSVIGVDYEICKIIDDVGDESSYSAFRFRLAPPPPPFPHATTPKNKILTLPTDSNERKNVPLLSGCLKYFPAALAGVAMISKAGNDKHNPGQPLHHARGKSMDHGDCILRHLADVEDLLAAKSRGEQVTVDAILTEVNQLAWRTLAYSQELQEKFGAPLAPGAK